jgi:hypothetical protein
MHPISVLIPTRNCAALIPDHLQSLRPWLDLADEVVVVDSDSHDGTLELLRAGLNHPRVRFLNHPPGLYQSWNFGIQSLSAKYTYISTVGDGIQRAGLEHLLEWAEKLQSDVVISKPAFINAAGHPLPDQRWPIDLILHHLRIRQPQLLSTTEQFLFAVTNLWGAILGSSASNLYRTECLQKRPFPTDFGTAGDLAWSLQNIFDLKIVVTPERFSTFRFHEKPYAPEDYYVESLLLKLFRLAQEVVARQAARRSAVRRILEEMHWSDLETALAIVPARQAELEQFRRQITPWFLNLRAWQARAARNQAERKISLITGLVVAAAPAPGLRREVPRTEVQVSLEKP